jgi:hypothetical protein
VPPDLREELSRAVGHVAAGDWARAHEIVQEYEGDAVASWIHALCHRIEGDLDNARYWYRRCARRLDQGLTTAAELALIEAALQRRE